MTFDAELWVRLFGFLPLAGIAYELVQLRRMLPSRSWTLKMIGFLLLALQRLLAVFSTTEPDGTRTGVPLVIMMMIGVCALTLLWVGYALQRQDLLHLRQLEIDAGPDQ